MCCAGEPVLGVAAGWRIMVVAGGRGRPCCALCALCCALCSVPLGQAQRTSLVHPTSPVPLVALQSAYRQHGPCGTAAGAAEQGPAEVRGGLLLLPLLLCCCRCCRCQAAGSSRRRLCVLRALPVSLHLRLCPAPWSFACCRPGYHFAARNLCWRTRFWCVRGQSWRCRIWSG